MINKKDIINFIFVASFPLYGLGCHFGRSLSPSKAIIFSLLPYLAIVIFYLIDILYKRDFQVKVRGAMYWWMMAYIFSVIASSFVSLYKGAPSVVVTITTATGSSLLYLTIFHAFIIVFLYNGDNSHEVVPRLTVISIGILLLINVIAYYVFGISSGESYYEGRRDDYPFFKGAFEAGSMAAIACLLVAWSITKVWTKSFKVFCLMILAGLLIVILTRVNSRIAILVMLITFGLFAVKWTKNSLVYWISLFTLPLVLNSRYLLYKVISLPILEPLMQRTDFEDIVTLHGRTILWERGLEWLQYDQRGLFCGLGLQGQYFIDLLRDIQLIWHPLDPHIMHWHSVTLEVLVNQGLLGLIPLLVIFYKIFVYYRQEFENKHIMGMFFLPVIYMLFSAQIDTFLLSGSVGMILFFFLVAGATIKTSQPLKGKIDRLSELEAASG